MIVLLAPPFGKPHLLSGRHSSDESDQSSDAEAVAPLAESEKSTLLLCGLLLVFQ